MNDGHCLNCGTILGCLDEDPNGDQNTVCAKCRAEEAHDFDADPNARFDRSGNRIEAVPCDTKEELMKLLELHRRRDWSEGDIAFECAILGGFDKLRKERDVRQRAVERRSEIISEHIKRREKETQELRREKDARLYYQDIVYAVCNITDKILGRKPGRGAVCGNLECPTDDVQRDMNAILHIMNELKSDIELMKICQNHGVKCSTCIQDMTEGRIPSSIYNEVVRVLKVARDELQGDRMDGDWEETLEQINKVLGKDESHEQENSVQSIVNEQAEDEGLWFEAVTAAEAYLQQELRRLHQAIE